MFETDSNFGNNPDLLRAYENILNDDLSGQTEQRKKARILPAGIKPVQFDGYGEKFKDVLDEFLVTSICGHFGVMPTEIGFTPKTGLGGSGHQNGEGQSSEVIGLVPLSEWVGRMLSNLSYVYLGMPRELEFRFQPSKRNDAEADARADDIRLKNGSLAINEVRAKLGYSLLAAEEADTPIFLTTGGGYFVSEDGMMDLATGGTTDATGETETAVPGEETTSPVEATPETESAPVETESEASTEEESESVKTVSRETIAEAKAFIRWLRKSPSRAFEFKLLPAVYAETLNRFVELGDYDGARWYAERYLS
jgi:hypothetical protein